MTKRRATKLTPSLSLGARPALKSRSFDQIRLDSSKFDFIFNTMPCYLPSPFRPVKPSQAQSNQKQGRAGEILRFSQLINCACREVFDCYSAPCFFLRRLADFALTKERIHCEG